MQRAVLWKEQRGYQCKGGKLTVNFFAKLLFLVASPKDADQANVG